MFDSQPISAEARTLRRIALLVLRAREDARDRSVADGLTRVAAVIDHMKRDLAVGSAMSDHDVASLAVLVRQLPEFPPGPPAPADVARLSVTIELRELVSLLRQTRGDVTACGVLAEAASH